ALLLAGVVSQSAVERTSAALATYAADLVVSLLVLLPWFALRARRWTQPGAGRPWTVLAVVTLALEVGIVVLGTGDAKEVGIALAGTLPLACVKIAGLAFVAARRRKPRP